MKALIVGGGIGGLTAALCLQKAGHSVQVFERSPEFNEVGAGIQCGANVVHVLRYLGVADAVERIAVQPERVEFRDYSSGKNLLTLPLGDAYQRKYTEPYWHVHRADLHTVLAQALEERSPGSVLFSAEFAAYQEHSNDSVTLSLADGREFKGDVLIGADGIRSKVRQQLCGQNSPRFTGNVAWRIVVPTSHLPEGWMDTIVVNYVGPKQHAVLYYLRKAKLANLVGVVENPNWTDDSWVVNAPWLDLKDNFAGWHPTVQAIIDAADDQECYRWALYDHTPLKQWVSNNVALLGDAAHASLPFMASGAAMAIEDARVLERCLQHSIEKTDTLAKGLQLYQKARHARTSKVQRVSAKMGSLYHLNNNIMRSLAFKGFKAVARANESFLPAYNANTIDLIR